MTAVPFPDSAALSAADLADDAAIPWPALPEGTAGWRSFGLTQAWVTARMPDGRLVEGMGETIEKAEADARRSWLRWKRAYAGPLAVDGHEYRRRMRNRRRR